MPASPAEARARSGRDRRRASPASATTLPSGSRARGPPRPQPSGGSPKAAFRTCAPRGVPRAERCVAARSSDSPRGARRQPALSLRARRQESSERHPSRSWCNPAPRGAPSKARIQHIDQHLVCGWSTGGHHSPCRQARPNSERRTPIVAAGVSRPAGSISHHRCARFRTQRLTPADPFRGPRGPPRTTKDGA